MSHKEPEKENVVPILKAFHSLNGTLTFHKLLISTTLLLLRYFYGWKGCSSKNLSICQLACEWNGPILLAYSHFQLFLFPCPPTTQHPQTGSSQSEKSKCICRRIISTQSFFSLEGAREQRLLKDQGPHRFWSQELALKNWIPLPSSEKPPQVSLQTCPNPCPPYNVDSPAETHPWPGQTTWAPHCCRSPLNALGSRDNSS